MRKRRALLAAAISVGLGLAITSPSIAAKGTTDPSHPAAQRTNQHDAKGYYDARRGTRGQQLDRAQSQLRKGTSSKLNKLRKDVGSDAQLSYDPATGTPSNVASRDGYLTRASTASPARISLGYVRAHLSDFGLTGADMSTFHLRTSYTDPVGTTHLFWEQIARGIPVFGNGLKAHVDKRGRLIAVQGSPVAGLTAKADAAPTGPALTAASARSGAAHDVGGKLASARPNTGAGARSDTTWSNGDKAGLVWFVSGSGVTLGWNTLTQSAHAKVYTHVVDAGSGRVLYRNNLVASDNPTVKADSGNNKPGQAYVYDYYPGARYGGKAKKVDFRAKGWLSDTVSWLDGAYAQVWSDVNDDNAIQNEEKTPTPTLANTRLKPATGNSLCSAWICTWDANTANSWKTNRNADAANAFYLASTFHDYLAGLPFGFNSRAGNFESKGGDPVLLQTLDGANTANGFPDANHIDNANMATPPDGSSPTMQMYLWHSAGATNAQDPYVPTSGAFDASVLLHEYTHGLSNRLVVDATGNSTLNSIQAGSMGEAWSDYYAMDYLVQKGFVRNTAKDGEILEGHYVAGGQLFRTEAMDCTVGKVSARCPQGGYTYGDFPNIGGAPEVHSSGEVWAQTLWDLHETFGHTKADTLITRAMELSPDDPTMLDMRNSILQADKVAYGSHDKGALWKVFAKRGMGWFAGAIDGGDTQPGEDFHLPPTGSQADGALSGTVTDANTHAPLVGAVVRITGHDSGFIGSLTATTDHTGHYAIAHVGEGTYAKVVVTSDGYEVGIQKVDVTGKTSTKDFSIRKDYAAASGGAAVTASNGPDFTSFGCGPGGAIDLSQGTGWGSTTGDNAGTATATPIPKAVTVKLAAPINIASGSGTTAFAIDPTSTCGDPGSSSTGEYTIEVSTNGTTWTTVADGHGAAAFTSADRYRYVNVPASTSVAGVKFVRFTMVSPQVPSIATNCPNGAFGGCQFMDMSELEVFGTPAT